MINNNNKTNTAGGDSEWLTGTLKSNYWRFGLYSIGMAFHMCLGVVTYALLGILTYVDTRHLSLLLITNNFCERNNFAPISALKHARTQAHTHTHTMHAHTPDKSNEFKTLWFPIIGNKHTCTYIHPEPLHHTFSIYMNSFSPGPCTPL